MFLEAEAIVDDVCHGYYDYKPVQKSHTALQLQFTDNYRHVQASSSTYVSTEAHSPSSTTTVHFWTI